MAADAGEPVTLRKPLGCRLGWHRWYGDGAMFTHADRCDRCGKFQSEQDGRDLLRERELWAQVPKDLPGDRMMAPAAWVLNRLHGLDIDGGEIAAGSAPVGRPDRSGRAREQAETSICSDEPTVDPAAHQAEQNDGSEP